MLNPAKLVLTLACLGVGLAALYVALWLDDVARVGDDRAERARKAGV